MLINLHTEKRREIIDLTFTYLFFSEVDLCFETGYIYIILGVAELSDLPWI